MFYLKIQKKYVFFLKKTKFGGTKGGRVLPTRGGYPLYPETSLLEAPMTILIPMFARALIMARSDPYSRTFSIEVDWRSFTVAGGCQQLAHGSHR